MLASYVVGFMFSPDKSTVLLIQKNKPPWQAGKLNGVGGHIEPGEDPHGAMIREFQEETGLRHEEWSPTALLVEEPGTVYFFHTFSDKVYAPKTGSLSPTPESLWLIPVKSIHRDDNLPVIPNLRVLIPLIIEKTYIILPVILRQGPIGP